MSRSYPAPTISPENKRFFDAADHQQLLLKCCNSCQQFHHYPRTICPFCGSNDTRWEQSAGDGEIYSLSVARRGVPEPFALAYVALKEGVTMLTNVESADLDSLRIGQAVKVEFRKTDNGPHIPVFVPA